jgi:hypothetical protein
MLVGDSGLAAYLSVVTHMGHLSGLLSGFNVREWIVVERCGSEVRLHDGVWPARDTLSK